MTFIQSIFLNIAKRLGLDLAEKKVNGLDYFEVDNISLTATISSRIATITLIDSDINVAGDNQRAQALNDILQEMESSNISISQQMTDLVSIPETHFTRTTIFIPGIPEVSEFSNPTICPANMKTS